MWDWSYNVKDKDEGQSGAAFKSTLSNRFVNVNIWNRSVLVRICVISDWPFEVTDKDEDKSKLRISYVSSL